MKLALLCFLMFVCMAQMNCKKTENSEKKLKTDQVLTGENLVTFERKVSNDSTEIIETSFEDINGCRKAISEKLYDKNHQLKSEWHRKFKTDNTQTCDFCAYTINKRIFKNGIINKEEQYFALSEQSEEEPCGQWKFYSEHGKFLTSKTYFPCE